MTVLIRVGPVWDGFTMILSRFGLGISGVWTIVARSWEQGSECLDSNVFHAMNNVVT